MPGLLTDPFTNIDSVKPTRPSTAVAVSYDPFELNLDFLNVDHELLQEHAWRYQFATQVRHPEHITLLEARGFLASIQHKARALRHHGRKH